jgi:transposase
LKLNVSDRTVARDLQALGGRYLSMPRGPLVVEGDEARRKAWCQQQLRDENYGVTSVFCDEKLFSLSQKGLKREWVLPGMARRHRKVGHTMMVNMFCAVCPTGRVFLKTVPAGKDLGPRHGKYEVIKPKKNPNEKRGRKRKTFAQKKKKARKGMDSEAFIDIILKPLSAVLNRSRGRTLYLDNAAVHVSKQTDSWARTKGLSIVRLSPRSPDLNITENVWAALEGAVWKKGIPKTLTELERWIKDVAKTMNFKHLYETIRPRTAEVAIKHGKLLDSTWRKAENRRANPHLKSLA